jgi:hypothetical protein
VEGQRGRCGKDRRGFSAGVESLGKDALRSVAGRLQEGGTAMIKKVAGGYQVLSSKGKNLGGPYKTKKEAEKRLRQVEFFKHKKG